MTEREREKENERQDHGNADTERKRGYFRRNSILMGKRGQKGSDWRVAFLASRNLYVQTTPKNPSSYPLD